MAPPPGDPGPPLGSQRPFLSTNVLPVVERCMSAMQAGTQMVKLRGGAKGLVRFYFLDEQGPGWDRQRAPAPGSQPWALSSAPGGRMTGVTLESSQDIIEQFEPCPENKSKGVLGIDGFTNYMRSPAGDIFAPEHRRVHQDMTRPLSHYFIASSHNTYLAGDQLMSQSRADMYAWVLQAGCRCVEVDCWDGPDGEPIVHHGYTLTSKILFKDVIETINRYAFAKNEYPVILSIENHCSVAQQKKMAQYLTDILGDKLDLSSVSSEDASLLPSPQALKGKVLVKAAPNRKRAEHMAKRKLDSLIKESRIRDREDLNDFAVSALPLPARPGHRAARKKAEEDVEAGEDAGASRRNSRLLVHSLSKRKVGGAAVAPAVASSWQVSSFSETRAQQVLQQKPEQYLRFNQRQLSRIYPSSYRVDSSNYNPQPFWNAGCQMGGCAEPPGRGAPLSKQPRPGGSCGPRWPPGWNWGRGDTSSWWPPGFNPMWEETLVFVVHMPDIALVRFLVWDHDPIGRDFIGQRTLAFSSMMPGYRHVYLEGMEEASIFVHVAISDVSGKVSPTAGPPVHPSRDRP
ncbi:PREDICTED: 1-phosphatidylinositol 4,5-bisphosphate phosphodiesterase eta-2 [Myotis davidii]|uniref:1-phosphatidylinositol 4,5-bisphosphate phosphodiesterase eta-2 n=1 Tax=Myotis davidii TaxID=225400 RepID=UPI000767794E|nr:PREDICTED: 1-phosphatidylinositol 4,5-bisphosphate phosphodiesterase eta-2 [Myotis davidii]